MSPRLIHLWDWLMRWEGRAYENDPNDSGGPTKFGIDHRSHPNVDIRKLTEDDAKKIYQTSYWDKYHCEGYSYPLGEVIFNIAVNAGYGRVEKIFARGAKTAKDVLDELDAFYRRHVEAVPKDRGYLKGWLNRTASLRNFLGING
jgi:lysozyme family protein